jgi:hypothetical protein
MENLLLWRNGYSWNAKERRGSGGEKREFEELLKQDWLEFDPTSRVSNVAARLASS